MAWTLPWYSGQRTIQLSEGTVTLTDTFPDSTAPRTQQHPWTHLLTTPLIGSPAIEAELLALAARTQPLPRPPDLQPRAAFWRRLQPARITLPDLHAPAAPGGPRYPLWAAPGALCHGPSPAAPPRTQTRWDDAFFLGPPCGGLSLDDRRALKTTLAAALDPGPPVGPGAPLVDHDRLPPPTTTWAQGDATVGTRIWLEQGWLIWEGWDSTGRPEGGQLCTSVEHALAGRGGIPMPLPPTLLAAIRAAILPA